MPGDRVIPLDGGEVLICGWYVQAVTTLVERQINAARADGVRGGRLFDLLDGLRIASSRSCAAQPPQLPSEADCASWPLADQINVKETATLMNRTESNVRKRCKGGSLGAIKVGGEWVLSRRDVMSRIIDRKAS